MKDGECKRCVGFSKRFTYSNITEDKNTTQRKRIIMSIGVKLNISWMWEGTRGKNK